MDEFMGIVKLFAGNFAPRGWALCNGQLLSIAQNTALFSLLGNTYGGDGVTTFALPDYRSRVPIGLGQGPGLSNYTDGQFGGSENVALTSGNLPAHTHPAQLSVSAANAADAVPTKDASIAAPGTQSGRTFTATLGFVAAAPDTVLNAASVTVGSAGSSLPFSVLQPYLGMNYIICTQGIYPSRP